MRVHVQVGVSVCACACAGGCECVYVVSRVGGAETVKDSNTWRQKGNTGLASKGSFLLHNVRASLTCIEASSSSISPFVKKKNSYPYRECYSVSQECEMLCTMNTSKECLEMTENHVRGVKQEG